MLPACVVYALARSCWPSVLAIAAPCLNARCPAASVKNDDPSTSSHKSYPVCAHQHNPNDKRWTHRVPQPGGIVEVQLDRRPDGLDVCSVAHFELVVRKRDHRHRAQRRPIRLRPSPRPSKKLNTSPLVTKPPTRKRSLVDVKLGLAQSPSVHSPTRILDLLQLLLRRDPVLDSLAQRVVPTRDIQIDQHLERQRTIAGPPAK